jgi:hypothetical protein
MAYLGKKLLHSSTDAMRLLLALPSGERKLRSYWQQLLGQGSL